MTKMDGMLNQSQSWDSGGQSYDRLVVRLVRNVDR